jgi:hypothetical protein
MHSVFYPLMNFRHLIATTSVALALIASAPAENLALDHPTAATVKKYLEAVVKQDWTTASGLLLPDSLERRKQQMILAVKNSATMTEEASKLSMLGMKDITDLQKMSPQDAYVADRKAVHERMKITPETLKKKQETLVINILGIISEQEGKVAHAIVRTKQDTTEASIEELLIISMSQDKDNAKKWLVVPDMQQPITTPLKK